MTGPPVLVACRPLWIGSVVLGATLLPGCESDIGQPRVEPVVDDPPSVAPAPRKLVLPKPTLAAPVLAAKPSARVISDGKTIRAISPSSAEIARVFRAVIYSGRAGEVAVSGSFPPDINKVPEEVFDVPDTEFTAPLRILPVPIFALSDDIVFAMTFDRIGPVELGGIAQPLASSETKATSSIDAPPVLEAIVNPVAEQLQTFDVATSPQVPPAKTVSLAAAFRDKSVVSETGIIRTVTDISHDPNSPAAAARIAARNISARGDKSEIAALAQAITELPPEPLTSIGTVRADTGPVTAIATSLPQPDRAAPAASHAEPSALATSPAPAIIAAPASLQSFGFASDGETLSYDDELILEIGLADNPGTDTIIAYGSGDGIYLPFGAVARFLDLSFTVSDDGNFASGWFLSEDRTLTIDLRQSRAILNGVEMPLEPGDATAFDGELYLRAAKFADLLPLTMTPDLRNQSVTIATLEPFPFEARLAREAARRRLGAQENVVPGRWPREETPWLPISVPIGDLELRAVSESARGSRLETDLRLAGDLAYMTAEVFLGADTKDGLIGAFIELGRQDADADLLGPLKATEFTLGDVATNSMPLGLRGVSGRGFAITNAPIETVSVFEEIDLRGFLADGYEVELYRNNVLIESTRTPINGQYEFLQIPVDYGLNIFKLIFFGPQGQRREETRRITVGDGRLAPGKLVYRIGTAQRDVNLLDVRRPEFRPARDFGRWRASTQVDYGLTSDLTTTASAAWFDTDDGERWLATAGLRSGIGALAVKADLGISDREGRALEVGVGGRLLGGSFTVSHTEYRGGFIDETRSFDDALLNRASELDINLNLALGRRDTGTLIPITGRLRHLDFQSGRKQTSAALRTSTRFTGGVVSNTFDLNRTSVPGGGSTTQLLGNFDLATLSRSRTQVRASLGYAVFPQAELSTAALEVDHRVDDRTRFTGGVTYGFRDRNTRLGLSASRQFDRMNLSLNGQYGVRDGAYAATLRLGFSFGRNPLSGNFFIAQPGRSASGAVAIRAYQDLNGDRIYDEGDLLLPEVSFTSSNRTDITDDSGAAFLDSLGRGNRVNIQVDPGSFPDINLIPATRGIEIVPRPGRIHVTDFAVLATSEIEGTVYFDNEGTQRGVSGVQLQLLDSANTPVKFRRTESDGYYFFEQVPQGDYTMVLDPAQAERLNLCLVAPAAITVTPDEEIVTRELTLRQCT